MKFGFVFFVTIFSFLGFGALNRADADQVVQIPVASILNTRSVTTLANNKLYTWQFGIDGNGGGDGYMTMAASLFNGDKAPHALPDTSLIPATARHPEVLLHYSNADSTGNQTHYVQGAGNFTFPVPQGSYSKLFIFLTSSEGASTLQIQLTYTDSTETKNVVLPDYFNLIPDSSSVVFNLVKDLAKWTKANKMAETSHHNIDGVEVHPAARKILTSVKVTKTAPAYLVFWGATGIATGPVSTGLQAMGSEGGRAARSTEGYFEGLRVRNLTGEIRFENLPRQTAMRIYSTTGILVARGAAAESELRWNLQDLSGGKVAAGVYLCELRAGKISKRLPVLVSP